jgi:hypothetical protein
MALSAFVKKKTSAPVDSEDSEDSEDSSDEEKDSSDVDSSDSSDQVEGSSVGDQDKAGKPSSMKSPLLQWSKMKTGKKPSFGKF